VGEFSRAIREHRELTLRNRVLDETMPLQHYLAETAIEDHALFTSEAEARLQETHEPVIEPWPEREYPLYLEAADSLWKDDPAFNWGD
jgi:DNA primase